MSGSRPRTDSLPERHAVVESIRIRVIDGDDAGRELLLTRGECVVGSAPGCTLRIHDGAISGRHCAIALTEAGVQVTDLGSRNGTFYLGARVTVVVVEPGATLSVGRSKLLLASAELQGVTISSNDCYGEVIGSTPVMRHLFHALEQLDDVDAPVLLLGETGVGKTLVARALHRRSRRRSGPFEVFDCGAAAKELIASELFGHVRGAFTSAGDDRAGVFTRANGGTVFLDEIGELPLESQPKLLRIIDEKKARAVGSNIERKVDVRIISATHQDLEQLSARGAFREDLLFRLGVVSVFIPPLRERREDIPRLVAHILGRLGKPELRLSADTLELFTSGYDWPGNVRELRNAIISVIEVGRIPERLRRASEARRPTVEVDTKSALVESKRRIINAFEREYALAQLSDAGGNVAKAARNSGMDRNHFKRILKKHGLLGSSG